VRQSWCHQSQIREWLPWVGRHEMEPPADLARWEVALRERFRRQRLGLGLGEGEPVEVFAVTRWGETVSRSMLERDFPGLKWLETFQTPATSSAT
jgi:hypothetical protein